MLMDIVWIGVIGAGTRAKATVFMYSEVVAPTASLRHDGVLETPPASSVGEEERQLCGSGHEPLPGVSHFRVEKCSFTSLLGGHRSGDQILCHQSLEHSLSDPN